MVSKRISFTDRVLNWAEQNGRHDLPWQQSYDAYRIWLSEIMLQQTQVSTVIPYYIRFVDELPTIHALADASLDQVLHLWSGLGYYSRARNLHKSANIIVEKYDGKFPKELEQAIALPGIGRSTASAILAFAYELALPILDANVKRVLARFYAIEAESASALEKCYWQHAEANTPPQQIRAYTQAIMDFGALQCRSKKPRCEQCLLATDCLAYQRNRVSDFPKKQQKKLKPLRSMRIAIVENERGQVLLEQRPPTGVWGGLWLPPEVPTGVKTSYEHYGYRIKLTEDLDVIRHSFSHFNLDIIPHRGELVGAIESVAESATLLWNDPDSAQKIGMPAPIKKLLSTL